MIVTLIGYRGSGKTSVAAPLAQRLGFEFVDADADIEHRAGRSIEAIFAADGEREFRRIEREVLHELLQRDQLVIAAGGGAIVDKQTRQEMREAGPVVWLTATVGVLEQRIRRDEASGRHRPNLTRAGGRDEIVNMLARREPLYHACATLTIDSGRLPVDQIVERVVASLNLTGDEERM